MIKTLAIKQPLFNWAWFLLAALVLCASPAGAVEGNSFQPLSEDQKQRLTGGGVVVRTVMPEGEQRAWVQAVIIISAPPALVWHTLVDYEHATEFVPGLKGCRMLERGPDYDIIEHRVDFSFLVPEVTYVFRADYQKKKRIAFKRLSGDLNDLEGNWSLKALDQGKRTRLTYTVYLDPGFWVPQWLVSLIMQADVPELMMAMRDRVQGAIPGAAQDGLTGEQ